MSLLETGILASMNDLGLTRLALSGLTGIREQHLCAALKCSVRFSNSDIENIHKMLGDLKKLQLIARPFRLPMHDISELRFLLARLNDNDLDGVMTPRAQELAIAMDAAR